jgi:hypothetical protein
VDSIPIARTSNNSTGFFVTTSSCRPAVSCVGDVDLPFFSEPSGAAKRLEDGFALKIGIVSKDFVDRAAGANPSEEHQEIPLRRYARSLQFPQSDIPHSAAKNQPRGDSPAVIAAIAAN